MRDGSLYGYHLSFLYLTNLLFIYIPSDYLMFVSERLAQLNFLSTRMNELDSSDTARIMLLEKGLLYGMESPLWGNGYYSFAHLLMMDYGSFMYSHNNFVESFVGGGVMGFLMYYSLYYIIYRRCRKVNKRLDTLYLLFIILIILLFNHLSIVVLQERFIWILLALLYVGAKYYTDIAYENRISCC